MEIKTFKPHAISGIFWLGSTTGPSEKFFCIRRKEPNPIPFHGIIGNEGQSPYPDPRIIGEILDTYIGNSAVFNLHMDEEGHLSFDRESTSQRELRSFSFIKNAESVFVGRWSAVDQDVVISGVATCIITPLPKSFFEEPK